jgi:hypothetical protein
MSYGPISDIENFFLFRAQVAQEDLEAVEDELGACQLGEETYTGTERCKQTWQLNQLPLSLVNLQAQEMGTKALNTGALSRAALECRKIEIGRT